MRTRVLGILLIVSAVGCTHFENMLPTESWVDAPTLAQETKTSQILKSLPPAKQLISLSVYDFNDYTGQNKPGETVQYSRAVTQGGLSILKKALIDAGEHQWFRVLERGGLNHLIQERKIVRSVQEEYGKPDEASSTTLRPLLYSGTLLEGGIIAFESNVFTGGVGARYLGIGGSHEYRRDMVTVYVRAVSVATGEVLQSVSTSKTIYSTAMSGGIFKFVSFDKLIESESGFSVNEPPQLAVRQAIEMAVYALIMEGAKSGLWQFKNGEAGRLALEEYQKRAYGEKTAAESRGGASQVSLAAATSGQRTAITPQPGWYIQVAAARDSEKGKQRALLQHLSQAKLPVSIQSAAVNGESFHRVLVGPFASRQMAEEKFTRIQAVTRVTEEPFVREVK